jgi:hypothetical protein
MALGSQYVQNQWHLQILELRRWSVRSIENRFRVHTCRMRGSSWPSPELRQIPHFTQLSSWWIVVTELRIFASGTTGQCTLTVWDEPDGCMLLPAGASNTTAIGLPADVALLTVRLLTTHTILKMRRCNFYIFSSLPHTTERGTFTGKVK